MTAPLPRGVKLKRLQKRKRKLLLNQIRRLLGVQRIHRKKLPVRCPFPIDVSLEFV